MAHTDSTLAAPTLATDFPMELQAWSPGERNKGIAKLGRLQGVHVDMAAGEECILGLEHSQQTNCLHWFG
jgi:hypothetical protein